MKDRHRIARSGLAALAFAGIALSLVACIFDKGDYQGGGRQPAVTATITASGSGETPPPPPPGQPPPPPPPPPGDGGGG